MQHNLLIEYDSFVHAEICFIDSIWFTFYFCTIYSNAFDGKTVLNWIYLTNAYSIYLERIDRHTTTHKPYSRRMNLLCNDFSCTLATITQNPFWQWQKFDCIPN